ncbi:hypothetical protein MIR68_002751 [Amoeboaphelidium protococcarum]|nr:hypothetical protein MIR68_002751 [Amoeboaphelidium protococcarum]
MIWTEQLEQESDLDQIFEELENEELDANIREARFEQLRKEQALRQEYSQREHGKYLEVQSEKEVFEITTQTKRCIVHFYHQDFPRCQIMDRHLQVLAERHFNVKFVKVCAERCPFLVQKMRIQVLPCVIVFMNGLSLDKLIGFEDLGNSDDFTTATLEQRLQKSGVLLKIGSSSGQSTSEERYNYEDSEDDY